MPYITPERKPGIWDEWPSHPSSPTSTEEPGGAFVIASEIETVGELNFAITKLIQYYLKDKTDNRYSDYNAIVGVLECAKLEFYRRAVVLYEDDKIAENGDVY